MFNYPKIYGPLEPILGPNTVYSVRLEYIIPIFMMHLSTKNIISSKYKQLNFDI